MLSFVGIALYQDLERSAVHLRRSLRNQIEGKRLLARKVHDQQRKAIVDAG